MLQSRPVVSLPKIVLSGCLIAALAASGAARADGDSAVGFNRDIRPLLSDRCFACHGPDAGSRQADLRLDRREELVERGTVVPGDVDGSELLQRIFSDDPDLVMPPLDSSKTLEPDEMELLRQWIEAGAPWEEHWAFVSPRRPALPSSTSADPWPQNAIDHFVLARIRAAGLEPNAPARPAVLARRAALDLTGLPPEQQLAERFVAASDSAAFGDYVRALMRSQHAGEHRARFWLDAARYGDTHGMHLDNYREIWPYRDWVIKAFNRNLPFDEFVVEQVAGDLLPESTVDQRVATGFNRCNITTSEGGAIPAELDVRYMVDRVETSATVFLGLTAGCAVCHDHKYDPITQREFYQLGAFFNNTTQPAMDGNQKDTPPVLVIPDSQFADEWSKLLVSRQELGNQLSGWKSDAGRWWSQRSASEHPVSSEALLLWLPLTEGDASLSQLPAGTQWAKEHPYGRGVRFAGDSAFDVEFPTLRSDEPLTVSFWYRTPDKLISTTLFEQTATLPAEKEGAAAQRLGWTITTGTDGNLRLSMMDGQGSTVSGLLPDNEALKPRTWQHVCVRYSGGQSNSSISMFLNGERVNLRGANSKDVLAAATQLAEAPLTIAGRLDTAGLSDVRIYRRWLSHGEAQLLAQDGTVLKLLAGTDDWQALDASSRELVAQYQRESTDADYQQLQRRLAAAQRRRDFIYARSTTTLISRERETLPRAWILQRGEYDQPLAEVSPAVPAVLPPLPPGAPANRLGLAQWLVREDHPLTARVMVNRLWQSVFGVGLVKTSEDFGVMGDRPSHPQLLDWLAVEFIESGWDVNHMLELMVTSATYQQSAQLTDEKLRVDADNRLLARGVRTRLDAEVLRDQVLAVSGLLQRSVGGPSVKPYQPPGLWKVVAFNGSNTDTFQQDSGNALYRRSLYTFWKRTSPPPSMAAFNAPTREQCTVRRERTNTPLQALVLMNDKQFVEAARRLAERTLANAQTTAERAAWLYQAALGRPIEDADLSTMTDAAEAFRAYFADDAAAEALLGTGDSKPRDGLEPQELAAWTMVANIVMNRDDFINK